MDDRVFRVGGKVCLYEWDPKQKKKTGRKIYAEITYVAQGIFGLNPDLCVFNIEVLEKKDPTGSVRMK